MVRPLLKVTWFVGMEPEGSPCGLSGPRALSRHQDAELGRGPQETPPPHSGDLRQNRGGGRLQSHGSLPTDACPGPLVSWVPFPI